MDRKRIFTVERVTAGWAVIWGLYVGYPGTNFFDRNLDLYGPMLYLVPSETAWGVAMFGIGVMAFVLNFLGHLRLSALIIGLASGFFSSLYWSGDPGSPAGALYSLFAIANLYHWYFSQDK